MDYVETLEAVRVLLCFAFLAYASIRDYRKREVSNIVWVWFAPIGTTLTLTQFILFEAGSFLQLYAFSVFITSVFAILLFYTGAFGGADAKGLICIALTLPVYPEKLFQPLFPEASPFSTFFPVMIFFNAVLMAALSVFYAIFRNLWWKLRTKCDLFEGFERETFTRKLLVVLCGYKISLNKLKDKKFLYPLEDVEEDKMSGCLKRKLLVFPKDEKREEILGRILKFTGEAREKSYIWATPGLPLMIFILLGFLTGLFVGDLIWTFLVRILG
jgi:preflagellin peptidase FlaK